MIEIAALNPGLGQAITNRRRRKVRVVFPAREPLFLGGGNNVAVYDKAAALS